MTQTAEVTLTADILVVWRGMLLLIKRGKSPYQGCWALPGGKLGEGETLEEAAYRELYEETGVDVTRLQFVGLFDAPDRDPRGRYISAAYLATIPYMTDVEVQAGDDAAVACWFPLNTLPSDLAFDHERIIGRAMEA